MSTCCICLLPFEPREVQPPAEKGCPDAPMICSSCRRHPEALNVAHQLLEQHLAEHRDRGDFRKITLSNSWRDKWRAHA
jgi:hypothetical protein